ncbi:MAG: hypothetical protein M1837_006503 [Sclerophora amabilis]|nr:MAG: hypothetical protein M1837_006503 [Sclerophora amabilis]
MTHNQGYYGQYNHVQQQQHPQQPPPPPPPPPQTQSQPYGQNFYFPETPNPEGGDGGYFGAGVSNAGVDGGYNGQTVMSPGNGPYSPDTTAGRQDGGPLMSPQGPPAPQPSRQSTYGPALSGYRHQYQAPSPPIAQAPYNPQHFARPHSQSLSHQSYDGSGGRYASAPPQPYNPAAYQGPPSQSYAQHAYGSPNPAYSYSQDSPASAASNSGFPPQQHGYSPDPARPVTQYASYQPQNLPQASPVLPAQPGSAPPSHRSSAYPPAVAPSRPFHQEPESVHPNDYHHSHGRQRAGSQAAYSHAPSQSHNAYPQASQTYSPSPNYNGVGGSSPNIHRTKDHSSSPRQNYSNALPSPPAPPPPQHSPQRSSTLGRHPHARPLPGPPQGSTIPEEYNDDVNGDDRYERTDEELAQESIWKEVEAAVMDPRPGSGTQRRSPRIEVSHEGGTQSDETSRPLPMPMPNYGNSLSSRDGRPSNGHPSALGTGQGVNYDVYSDDSDAEAAMGVAAMRMAEEQDAVNGLQFGSSGPEPIFRTSGDQHQEQQAPAVDVSSDSDYATVDMSSMGGGQPGHLSYGAETNSSASYRQSSEADHHRHKSVDSRDSRINSSFSTPSLGRGPGQGPTHDYFLPDQDAIHPFRSFQSVARVDTDGTGGLAEPSAHPRRMSFDEGDERSWDAFADERSNSQSPSKEDFPEMFYHPTRTDRPLPPVPSGSDNSVARFSTRESVNAYEEAYGKPPYPLAPDAYESQLLSPTGLPVPRSTSLSSHTSTAQTVPPARAKTDAEEQRRSKLVKQQQLGIYASTPGSEITSPQGTVPLDLPSIPAGKRKKFLPNKLSSTDFKRCAEPWAFSSIAAWLKEMSEGEADLREKTIVDGLVALFTHKVPTMNIADAETLSARVVQELFNSEVLIHEEEWVKFGPQTTSGVIWQLTGTGCYAPRLHTQDMSGRCYSHHCSRTLKKINLHTQVLEPQRKLQDWATFYKIKKDDIDGINKKEVERQNNLHEIVQTEDQYMDQLNVLGVLYRDQLLSWQPSIIAPKRLANFTKEVFGKADAVKKVNEDFLLAQLKYRQQEEGPWITGFSDIFREWIRKAKNAYLDYAASFPKATLMVRKEAETNILFRQFLDQARDNERSKRLGWDTYLKAPITRLQRYTLLLSTVLKNMPQENEEKTNLQTAIEEVKNVTMECDARYAEMSKKVDLLELNSKLILRPGMERVELNLNHLGRELIFEGDLQRTGANRFNWLEIRAILFDHYFVLAKTVHQKDTTGGVKRERYDVSKVPIPMDLLVLDSTYDEPVVKNAVRGIGAVTTVTTKAQTPTELRLGRTATGSMGPGTLTHTNTDASATSVSTNSSGKTMVTNTVLENSKDKDEKIMYPFRVKHLGKDVYTLYAPTAQSRNEWCSKILEAKTKHAASLFAQNAEPFRLRVIADCAFGYDYLTGGPRSMVIKGTPLYRAVRDVETMFESAGPRPGPVCRAAVNCATAFHQPYGKAMVAVGTDFGVYLSQVDNPRGWSKAITATRVTQIAVLEEFSLFLVIADKALIAYHLDVVCPVAGVPPSNDSARKAPQKLSGTREVGFFATGRMKDRALVLEPVFQKATEKKSRFSRKGNTEFFREFDEFYIPTECFGINLFHSSLAVSTSRGFEVLTLDKKQGWAVPDLKQSHVANIATRLTVQKPLGMFRLNDTEFLLCYEECAVYVNKHGDVSRSVIMEFVGKALSAAMYGPYVLLFDNDFVEIRNAENGRLRQVISGRDVKCLDDAQSAGTGAQRTVKISLQHPEMERTQIVVELLLNEGQRD